MLHPAAKVLGLRSHSLTHIHTHTRNSAIALKRCRQRGWKASVVLQRGSLWTWTSVSPLSSFEVTVPGISTTAESLLRSAGVSVTDDAACQPVAGQPARIAKGDCPDVIATGDLALCYGQDPPLEEEMGGGARKQSGWRHPGPAAGKQSWQAGL